jgi:hypothetical protein
MPARDKETVLEVDASDFAIGGIVSQKQKDKKYRPVAYLSKSLSPTKRNYPIYDRELLAIVESLKEFCPYVLGNRKRLKVLSNHSNLSYFHQPQDLNCRQARWMSELQDYDFIIEHKPGNSNQKPGILSRRPGHERGENDNQSVILLPDDKFAAIRTVHINELSSEISDLIETHHSSPTTGHPEIQNTIELLHRSGYNWPNLKNDVQTFVKACPDCQRSKPNTQRSKPPLHPFDFPPQPGHTFMFDFIGPLPESNGYDFIFVIIEKFLKKAHFIPTHSNISAGGFARIFAREIFREFRILE